MVSKQYEAFLSCGVHCLIGGVGTIVADEHLRSLYLMP